jgi:hypothetical protein
MVHTDVVLPSTTMSTKLSPTFTLSGIKYYQICVFVVLCVHCFFFTLDAGLLARSQYLEGPATGHLDTGFSWFPCVYKQMLR